MDEFEKAAWEVDKNINSNQENVIEWLRNSHVATVTLSQPKHVNRVKSYAKKYPDAFQIVAENADGSVVAHIPLSAIKIYYTPPKQYTEEEKEAMRTNFINNMKKGKAKKSGKS